MVDGRAIVGVVDDDLRVLESLEELLESAGLGARLFTSAMDFLDSGLLREIDCLISDVGMPVMDGRALRRMVRRQRPDLPVILITGRREHLTDPGATPDELLFEKPFDGPALLDAIHAEIRRLR